MGTKKDPGRFDCYASALPDEPMFVLLARDPRAPELVLRWAATRSVQITLGVKPDSDLDAVTEAHECAVAMGKWREENDGRWRPKPDSTRELVRKAMEAYDRLPKEEQDKMWAAQRESWARQDMD